MKVKTVEQWLNGLPDGIRERALNNLNKSIRNMPVKGFHVAIRSAFKWEESPEGPEFWQKVRNHIWLKTPLPELPKD